MRREARVINQKILWLTSNRREALTATLLTVMHQPNASVRRRLSAVEMVRMRPCTSDWCNSHAQHVSDDWWTWRREQLPGMWGWETWINIIIISNNFIDHELWSLVCRFVGFHFKPCVLPICNVIVQQTIKLFNRCHFYLLFTLHSLHCLVVVTDETESVCVSFCGQQQNAGGFLLSKTCGAAFPQVSVSVTQSVLDITCKCG